MKATRYDTTNDIVSRYVHSNPTMQRKVRGASPDEIAGSIELAWRRGQHAGIYDAYRALRRTNPDAATQLLSQFGLTRSGKIRIG